MSPMWYHNVDNGAEGWGMNLVTLQSLAGWQDSKTTSEFQKPVANIEKKEVAHRWYYDYI